MAGYTIANGNIAEFIQPASDDVLLIRNSSCAQYYLRVVIRAP